MKPVLSLTESQTLQALRTFLLGILPDGVEVVQGEDNRVAEPAADYVLMTPMGHAPLSTVRTTFHDGAFDSPPTAGVRMDLAPAEVTVQLDIHGPNSSDNKTLVVAMFKTSYATAAFAATGFDVAPLYLSDPHQIPFLNGEQQIERTWVAEAHLQCNPVITTAQDFAASLGVEIISVDQTYPA